MFLAQSLVFFGEEWLTFQIGRADLWREPNRCRPPLLFKQHSQHFLIFTPDPCCCCVWHCLLDLPHTQSRCHARWTLEPPGTCPPPRWGSRSRGSWSQTGCSSLSEWYNDTMLFCLHDLLYFIWFTGVGFLLHLVHSMAVHPPCETCCLWLAVGRRSRWNRSHARSVSGHSWPPAEE